MNLEELRDYCLSLPEATECFPFDDTTLVFKVNNKMFAFTSLDDKEWLILKCEPELAQTLRAEHQEVEPAWHMNKRMWNQVNLCAGLSNHFICRLINHSYNEVVKKMPKKDRERFPVLDEDL